MVKRGGEADIERATVYFIKWWRAEGGLLSASSGALQLGIDGVALERRSADGLGMSGDLTPLPTQAWGFDFQWELRPEDVFLSGGEAPVAGSPEPSDIVGGIRVREPMDIIQEKMEGCIDVYLSREAAQRDFVSQTQVKKRMVLAEKERRKAKWASKQKG